MLNEYEMASFKIKSDKILLKTSYFSIDLIISQEKYLSLREH